MSIIVVIDDQPTTVKLLDKILKNIKKFPDVTVVPFTDETKALGWLKVNTADLILLDYKLPLISGIQLIKLLRQWPGYSNVPIVMVTAYDESEIRYEALDAGATDFITKPINYRECQARCANLLSLREHQLMLEDHNRLLSDRVRDTTETVIRREREALYHLAKAGEYRDADTGNHILRIAKYSRIIAQGIGMDAEYCELIEHASPMHDVGKIGIPDHILLKPGKLNPNEWNLMRRHSDIGYEILAGSSSKYMQMGATIALYHHEKYDGSGYPHGLTGEAIPLEARIVAIADVFDALTSIRPYKTPWTIDSAYQYLQEQSGKHFDPVHVAVFQEHRQIIERIHREFNDPVRTSIGLKKN